MGIILLIVIVGLGLYLMSNYNKLISLRNNREQSFADVDVQLQLRFDLVGNLINTVKGYAEHEKDTLENVTKARTSFMNANSIDDKIQANNMLTGALKSLFAVSESYPDLKANQNFLQLQTELSDIENKIAASRRFFNATTKEYNTYLQMFPTNIIGNLFKFEVAKFFEIDADNKEEIKKAPKVEF